VAGLEEPTEGSVSIGDRDVTDVPAKDRDLAMVFQSYALYPHMTVYDNMAFGLRMRKLARGEIDRLVRDAASTLGLDQLLQRRPGELSGGQRQRVALGRAIVRQPAAFLMDEPLSNLDAQMRVQTRTELIKLHQRLGTTFIYVTHDQVEAMTMGQRVAVMEGGELQQVAPPQEVYDRPANLFVAKFIGSPSMNFLEGPPEQVEGATGVRTPNGIVRLPPERWAALQQSGAKRVAIGIRPEHLTPKEGGDGAAGTFDGKVDIVESLGSEQHVTVALNEGSVVVRLPADLRLAVGAPLRLAVEARHLHLFDAESGARAGE
jgi:multiple sugar transport system ATP-binding protein